jgi:putative hydrolase of the HAD superfamily
MIRAVLFDLDDTLYPEREYFESGFAVVAERLEERGAGEAGAIGRLLEAIHFEEGREGVFDKAAARLGYPREWVPELVALFRDHTPRISLPAESAEVLRCLRLQYRLGIVTDGHASVQHGKIEALGLRPLVDAIIVTDELGRRHWKPHPLPFLTCCRALHVQPDQAIFVGDHPQRDIGGAHGAGLRAVRLRRKDGYFRNQADAAGEQAECDIEQLERLPTALAHLKQTGERVP